ncbi:MAG: hypothetical protein ACMXYK_05130 [Candidatus Woesearchaeota archaeon]
MKVYVVGEEGVEHSFIYSVHKSKKGALKAWNDIRISLLEHAKSCIRESSEDNDMFETIVKNLSCTDPEKLNNGVQDAPFLKEYTLQD